MCRNGYSSVAALVTVAIVAIGAGVGYVYRQDIEHTVSEVFADNDLIDKKDIDVAKANIRKILSSAQNSFVHRRSENRRMARSIEELGDGVNSHGCLIYHDIWVARYGRKDENVESDDAVGQKALQAPYRYAVLPVENVNAPELDSLTTCILAVPKLNEESPMLVMIAGPVRSDPIDFRRDWPIFEVYDHGVREKIYAVLNKELSVEMNLISEIQKGK